MWILVLMTIHNKKKRNEKDPSADFNLEFLYSDEVV